MILHSENVNEIKNSLEYKNKKIMKKQNIKLMMRVYLIFLSVFLISACSSDDNAIDDNPLLNESKFTMKVNGELWVAEWAFTQTYYDTPEDEDFEDEMLGVIISAFKDIDEKEGVVGETMTIVIGINRDKFNNPKGSYPVSYEDIIEKANFSYVTYYKMDDESSYVSYNIEEEKDSDGEVHITDFEIGNQMFLGKGYVKLSGNFAMDLYGYSSDYEEVKKLEITAGEFQVTSDYLQL